jgi:UDP-3-O-[3-hydroxymyristoyl] glucosamine N-acyltransferase
MAAQFQTTLRDVAARVGGEVCGDANTRITGVAGLHNIQEGNIIFIENEKLLALALRSPAAAVIAPKSVDEFRVANPPKPALLTDNPRLTFAKVVEFLAPRPQVAREIHPTATIGEGVTFGQNVAVREQAHVGRGSHIGDDVTLYPHTYVGENVVLGEGSVIFPFACVHDNVTIGKRVVIHCGVVIGSDGFGYVHDRENNRHYKIPQIGTVIVEDDVEIGANTTIDRATLDATVIGEGTKIDNLVQIGHNCHIGKHCIIAAQTGICGSTIIEDYVVLLGQVGVQGHITIGEGALVGAQGGVISDVPPGAKVSGYPAAPHMEKMRVEAASRKLPELLKTVRQLSKQVEDLTRIVESLQRQNGSLMHEK